MTPKQVTKKQKAHKRYLIILIVFYVVFPQMYSFLRIFAIDVASLGVSASASNSASSGSSAAIASAYLRRTR